MFVKCASLKTVKFKSDGNFKIQRFGRAFWFCDDLEDIDISAFDLRDSTSTSWAYLQEIFYQDFNLKRVAVGEGWLQKPSSKTNFTVNMYRIDDQSFTPHLKDTLIPNGKGEYVVRKMIKFDGNDADSGAMNDEHIYYSLSKKLPKNTFKRDGFIFAGWGLKQNDDTVDFTDRQSINFSDLGNSMNDVVLYAKWLPTVNIEVKKIWKYVNGNLINPPYQKTEIELYKDGKPTGNKLELNAANHWGGEFKQLPVAESPGSRNHKYTVKEFGEKNNSIKLGKMRFKVIYEGTMKEGYTIINEAVPLTLQKTPKQKPVTGVSADIKQLPKTGYRENLALYGLLLAISGGMLLIGLRRRRGNSKNNNTDISS